MSSALLRRNVVAVLPFLLGCVVPSDALASVHQLGLRRDSAALMPVAPARSRPNEYDLSLGTLQSVVARQLQWPDDWAGRNTTNATYEPVTHIALLNDVKFWLLMGTVIVSLGIAVVTLEVRYNAEQALSDDSQDEEKESPKTTHQAYTMANALHLLYCVAGLNVSMIVWGIAQEFVMTNSWLDPSGRERQVPSTLFVVLCNRLTTMVFTGVLIRLQTGSLQISGLRGTAPPAVTNLGASWCQYLSLEHVSFGLQTTFKCGKLLPVVVISSLRGKRYTVLDYAEVFVIVTGVIVFGLEDDSPDLTFTGKAVGVLFLCGTLVFDSLTPHLQDRLFESQQGLEAVSVTFGMALCAGALSFVVLLVDGMLFVSLRFLWDCPLAMLHILVLSLSSTVTQYTLTYTVKSFGPVVCTLITTTRQALSVCVSAVLFRHPVTSLESVASMLVFGTVLIRGLRPLLGGQAREGDERVPAGGEALLQRAGGTGGDLVRQSSEPRSPQGRSQYWTRKYSRMALCALGIHIFLGLYSLLEEYLATHPFSGEIFAYPNVLVASNRTLAALIALCILKMQGTPILHPQLYYTILPGSTMFGSSLAHYNALYLVQYPVLSVLKMGKLIPTMLLGRVIKNRSYNALDYLEGLLITVVGGVFVWSFQEAEQGGAHPSQTAGTVSTFWGDSSMLLVGVILMMVYVVMDAVTCNLEDYTYQQTKIDAGHMMLGEGIFSAMFAWVLVICNGDLFQATSFLHRHSGAWLYIALLSLAGACGTYACTLTVRLFGPMVFIMIMTSRQIVSLVASILVYQHQTDRLSLLAMVAVCLLILTASVRRIGKQAAAPAVPSTPLLESSAAGDPPPKLLLAGPREAPPGEG